MINFVCLLIIGFVRCNSYFVLDIDKTPSACSSEGGGVIYLEGRSRVECTLYCVRHGKPQVSYVNGKCYCYQTVNECPSSSEVLNIAILQATEVNHCSKKLSKYKFFIELKTITRISFNET